MNLKITPSDQTITESSKLKVESSVTNLQPSASTLQPSTDIAISVRNVSKMYPLYAQPSDRLKQSLWYALPGFLRGQPRQFYREFWALRDISFEVKKGETVGIIGRNGSGKSTLLQIIAGTLTPTSGEVQVNGRVAALLELGSGFNPEFTGRENVYLNGAILGFSREEIDARFDEIAAFADIGEFIDQSVKLYSSGMFARLAFAVSIHLEPNIFIVDEVLAVGDVFFQSRCVRKLDEFREKGGTVLFVTHDIYTIERICTRSIVLHQGRKIFEGSNIDATNIYYKVEQEAIQQQVAVTNATIEQRVTTDLEEISAETCVALRRDHVTGNNSVYIEAVSITNSQGQPTTTFQVGEWMTAELQVRFNQDVEAYDFGVGLRDRVGALIGGAHTFYQKQTYGFTQAGTRKRLKARLQLSVAPTTYLLLIGIAKDYTFGYWEDFYVLWDCCTIQVTGKPHFWGQAMLASELSDGKNG